MYIQHQHTNQANIVCVYCTINLNVLWENQFGEDTYAINDNYKFIEKYILWRNTFSNEMIHIDDRITVLSRQIAHIKKTQYF